MLPCGRLPGVTSWVLVAGVESISQESLLCHLKLETNLASAGIEPGSPDLRPDTQAHGHFNNKNYTLLSNNTFLEKGYVTSVWREITVVSYGNSNSWLKFNWLLSCDRNYA